MKRPRWACSSPRPWRAASAAALALGAALFVTVVRATDPPPSAAVVAPRQAQLIVSPQETPPAADDPRWRGVELAHSERARAVWYRVQFDADLRAAQGSWRVYLPYFNGGGRLWLNGAPAAAVAETSDEVRVRWERPMLLPLPDGALQSRGNELLLRVAAAHSSEYARLPRLVIGPQPVLQPMHDRRLFFVRTLPLVTVITGCVVGLLVLLIWWRRRQEVLYGLFGLAALLWALRTLTFVLDTLPPTLWEAWRVVYFACTGGFIVVMALFTLALAGWSRPWLTRTLFTYWALGPLAFIVGGEGLAARVWVAGLLPVGVGLAAVALAAAWRQRTAATVVIAFSVAAAALAGLHDYAMAWRLPVLAALAPDWLHHRIFLLHHGANLLLVVMGVLLAVRFVRSLDEVEQANRTLEARVRQRETEIAASYERIASLQADRAAAEERQRIMRDLHDGLGSQLFTSLSRAERGSLDAAAMSDTLRGAIDQMRIAIEALASDEQDFRTAFGNFRFRWDTRLREAGLAPQWQVDLPDEVLAVAPHDALQILHIAQEALTNVLKHARARSVTVQLRLADGALALDVRDDGQGREAAASGGTGGRGLANMRTRAQRLHASLDVTSSDGGTQVSLRLPLARDAA